MTDKPKQYAVEMIHVDNKFMSGVLYTPLSRVRESFDKYEELRDQMQARIEELEQEISTIVHGAAIKIASLESELAAEKDIVDRIWKQLGITTYEEAKGRSIYDCIAELAPKAREEALREAVALFTYPNCNSMRLFRVDVTRALLSLLDQNGNHEDQFRCWWR